MLERGQQIGRSLACTGWCRTQNITTLQCWRDSLGLNSRGAREAFLLQGLQQALVKFKFGKSGYSHGLPQFGALIIDRLSAIFICLCGVNHFSFV